MIMFDSSIKYDEAIPYGRVIEKKLTYTCTRCGKEFTVNQGEKRYSLPKRRYFCTFNCKAKYIRENGIDTRYMPDNRKKQPL